MTFEEFENKFCNQCGTQSCEREGEWLDACGLWNKMKDLTYAIIYLNERNKTVMSKNENICTNIFNEGVTSTVPPVGKFVRLNDTPIHGYGEYVLLHQLNNSIKNGAYYDVIGCGQKYANEKDNDDCINVTE